MSRDFRNAVLRFYSFVPTILHKNLISEAWAQDGTISIKGKYRHRNQFLTRQ